MNTLINVWNPSTGNEVITLEELLERIAKRRYDKLSGAGLIKSAQMAVSVYDRKETDQPATSYASFEIRQFNAEKAVEVYNAGGCQIARRV